MDFCDLAIDRIHFLADRASELDRNGMKYEAELMMQQAVEIAKDLREISQFAIAWHNINKQSIGWSHLWN